MSCCAHEHVEERHLSPAFRRALWIALAVNATMFVVEIVAGLTASSVSLQADALDFFGDAFNYALTLSVLGLGGTWRSGAALFKGVSMGAVGLWVVGSAIANMLAGTVPEAATMGIVGTLALVANVGTAAILYAYRNGDANARSVWLCSRNDAIGNVVVLIAAAGVFGTGTGWPDIVVAGFMAALALAASVDVVRRAVAELRGHAPAAAAHAAHDHAH